jgi:hypothetical protein
MKAFCLLGGVVMDAFETSILILKLFGGTAMAIAIIGAFFGFWFVLKQRKKKTELRFFNAFWALAGLFVLTLVFVFGSFFMRSELLFASALNLAFFCFLLLVIAAVALCIYAIKKLLKQKSEPLQHKRYHQIFAIISGIFAALSIAIFAFFVVRCYSLPVVGYDKDDLLLNGHRYVECNKEPPYGLFSLTTVGRVPINKGLSPAMWAIEVVYSPSYYAEKGDNEIQTIYYFGFMDPTIAYEKESQMK